MSEVQTTKKESESKRVRVLVDRAQQGDRAAIEELYLIHFDRIYSYLHVSVGNRHDAEDLTTQTFLRMLESITKFRWQSAPFSAWLFRIAHNLAMDHFRANKRWQPEEDVPEPEPDESTSAEAGAFESIGELDLGGRAGHTATTLSDGSIVVIGGYDDFGEAPQAIRLTLSAAR